jgi:hypothetical protein
VNVSVEAPVEAFFETLTVTLAELEFVPFSVTLVGEILHVTPEGAPEQVSETLRL